MPPKDRSLWRSTWMAGRLAGRRLVGRAVSERDVLLGERLTAELDQLKGLPMKLGQIVSYMDVPLPDEVVARMARLQTGHSGLDAQQTRAALEGALGDALEVLFSSFELAPVAAASIGQVHRAQVDDRQVAVKLQYPDVANTFRRDLGLVERLAGLASLASAVDGRAVVRELAERLEEECDYAREAAMQQRFAAAFAGDAQVHIPDVVPELCRPTVLTSAWVDGWSFEDLRQQAPKPLINAIAGVLIRFSYRSLLNLALIQADPHPGNFLFSPSGRVTFLDFGCVKELEPTWIEALRRSICAVRDGHHGRFRDAIEDLGLIGRPKKFDTAHFFAVMEHLYRPLLAHSFRFDAEFVKQGHELNGPSSPNSRALAIPPAYVWVMRLQWGLWSILGRLQAEGSFRHTLERILDEPVEPG